MALTTADPLTTIEDKWALYSSALAGPRHDYYLKHFRRIDAGAGSGLSWNWAAMLFTFSWLRYRRMYVFSWIYFFASTPFLIFILGQIAWDPCAAGLAEVRISPPQAIAILILLGYLLPPLFANRLYFGVVTRNIARVRNRKADGDNTEQLLQKSAGTAGYWASVAMMSGVVIFALANLPATGDYTTRAKISELILAGSGYKTAVHEYFSAHRRLPTRIEEIGGLSGSDRYAKSITLEKDGAIRVVAGFAPIAGRSVLVIPSVRDGNLVWSCRSDDIPNKCLPAACRR